MLHKQQNAILVKVTVHISFLENLCAFQTAFDVVIKWGN